MRKRIASMFAAAAVGAGAVFGIAAPASASSTTADSTNVTVHNMSRAEVQETSTAMKRVDFTCNFLPTAWSMACSAAGVQSEVYHDAADKNCQLRLRTEHTPSVFSFDQATHTYTETNCA